MSRSGGAPARPDVSVFTSGCDVADARLHRLVRPLVEAGLTVDLVGLGDPAGAPDGLASVRARPRRGLVARLRAALAGPWQVRGRVIVVMDPDAVPSASLRRLTGRRLVVDVREDYVALLRDRAWAGGPAGRVAAVGVRVASALAGRADLTVLADEHVPPPTARDRLVVRNLPSRDYLPEPAPADELPRAVYVGDVRASRGAFTMLEAVAAAPGWRLDVVGSVAAADEPALVERAGRSDLTGRVRLLGRMPPVQAWQHARGAWVGLSLLDRTPAFEAAVPSKLYEYLAVGLAVVVTDLPRQVEIVAASAAGVVVRDAAGAAAALRAYAAQPDLLAAHRRAGPAWAAGHLDGDAEYAAFADRVVALLGRSRQR